ncbi:MAG TPA: outer membrane beta-barrel protein [Parafilimonas sp.]|nr:outer membrane beta-barrel protein [Parafilimonas sp.]
MKKIFISLVFLTSLASAAHSQNVRLNLYGGYVFDDKVDNSYSYSEAGYFQGKIKGGFLWGGGLEFRLHEYYGLELLYQRLDTKAPIDYYGTIQGQHANIDLGINYIMVGGARSLRPPGSKAEPYGGFMLGMAIIDAKSQELGDNSATKFAWGLRLGTNVWASDRVGIKLQMQLLSIPQGAGGGLYFGTGGVGAGVSTYSTMLQFALGGGLTFKLGGQQPHTTPTQPQ